MVALQRRAETPRAPARRRDWHAPPFPREHGAWIMLFVPLALGLAASGRAPALPTLLLVLVSLSAFMAWEPAFRMLRGRGRPEERPWVAALLLLLAAAGAGLLGMVSPAAMAPVVSAGASAGLLLALMRRMGRKRLDRTLLGRFVAVAALTLTAPAAWVVSRGALSAEAWLLWAACVAFFASGVVHVKTLMQCAMHKGTWTVGVHLRHCAPTLLFHLLLGIVAVFVTLRLLEGGSWMAAAYLPVVARGIYGGLKPARQMPRLVRVGVLESLYAVWFLICASIAARMVLA